MYSHIVSISTNMSCCSFVQQTASMHGAVDEKMNLSYQSQCGLRHDKYIVEKNSNECSDGNVEEECVKHVFLTTYSRRSLSDHAWELCLWEEISYEPFYKCACKKHLSVQ
jgi:hypothetical protein